jgi:hypothetical protein
MIKIINIGYYGKIIFKIYIYKLNILESEKPNCVKEEADCKKTVTF